MKQKKNKRNIPMLSYHNEFMGLQEIITTEENDPDTQSTWRPYLPPAFPVAWEFL